MSYQLTGKIKVIGEIEQKTETFKIRKFVVTIDGETQYPQHIEMQAANDKCDILSKYTIGSDVTVSFNLRGREWIKPETQEVKHFLTLDAWKIKDAVVEPSSTPNAAPQQNTIPENQQPVAINPENTQGDDLPF